MQVFAEFTEAATAPAAQSPPAFARGGATAKGADPTRPVGEGREVTREELQTGVRPHVPRAMVKHAGVCGPVFNAVNLPRPGK